MTLEEKAARISDLIAAARSGTIEAARLLLAARREDFPDNYRAWWEWARAECGLCKRRCDRMKRAAEYLEQIEAQVPHAPPGLVAHAPLDVDKLDILAAIPVAQLQAFLAQYDLEALDREDLRDAVNRFLGRELTPRYVRYSRLPSPDDLRSRLMHDRFRNEIDPEVERGYSAAFDDALYAFRDDLPFEEVEKTWLENVDRVNRWVEYVGRRAAQERKRKD